MRPHDDSRHAEHAVAAALEMERRLLRFREALGGSGNDFDIGVGIHSGPAVVGFIGSEVRQDYTAIGDTVNLASRIEGETKGRCRILVSEQTAIRCQNVFDFVDRGLYKVRGRNEHVRLFEPKERAS